MKQTTFASVAWDRKGKVTRRERFLAEMDAVIPWLRLLTLIAPHYPKPGNGTQPRPMERMLRIHFMQHWFNRSDPAVEDALHDSESMRRFAGIELVEDAIPDESTILHFRHLLERHLLSVRIFAEIRSLLEEAAAVEVRDHRRCDDHRRPALAQKRDRGPRSLRAHLPRGQAPVGIHQGALSRPGQEHRARLFTAFARANLYLLRQRLLPPQEKCHC